MSCFMNMVFYDEFVHNRDGWYIILNKKHVTFALFFIGIKWTEILIKLKLWK